MIDTGIGIDQYEEWQALRHKDITSSDCPALFSNELGQAFFGRSYFSLWHEKQAPTPPEFVVTEEMEWGNALEPVIAKMTARKHGLFVHPKKTYIRHATLQAGSSFDYEIVGTTADSPYRAHFEQNGHGILEIKNVNSMSFKDKWKQEEGHDVSPYVELQVQHQLMVSGLSWALVGALVGGNRGHVVQINARKDVHRALEMAIEKFWLTQYANEEPQPDYKLDADFILSKYTNPQGERVYMDDPVIEGLVRDYMRARDAEKKAGEDKKALQAQIVEHLGDIQKASDPLETWKISRSLVGGKPDTYITPDMVGQIIKGKKAYTTFSVTGKGE